MKSIKSISELVKQLSISSRKDINNLIKRLEIPITEFEKIASWNTEFYTRNCIARTEDFELLLLCWQAGQETPIHCHNDQDCWVFLIEGNITENQYKNDDNDIPVLTVSELMTKNGSYYINDFIGLHSLHNLKNERAMSLHFYFNPIKECSYYNDKQKEYKTKILSYNSSVIV